MSIAQPTSDSAKRVVLPLASALTLIAVAALLWPGRVAIDPRVYLPLHTAMEAFSVLVAMLVFVAGVNVYRDKTDAGLVLLSSAFLAVGLIDFAHTLSFAGMPDFVTPSDQGKGIYFWLAARAVAAFALLAAALPWNAKLGKKQQAACLAASLASTAMVYWAVLYHQASLPHVIDAVAGLTPFKRGAEYLIVGTNAATALILFRRPQGARAYDVDLMFAAVAVLGLGELFFAAYSNVTDTLNLLGHGYKIVGYYLLYRAIFTHAIRAPYHLLSESEQQLRASEERYRLIVETAAEGIWLIDWHGTTVFTNQKMAQMLGYGSGDLIIGHSLFNFMDETDRHLIAHNLEHYRQRVGEQHEFKLRRRDGSEFWAHIATSPIFLQGEYLGALAMVSDITERKLVAQELAALQERNELILNSVGEGICGLDGAGRIRFANPAAARMLGYGVDGLLGQSLHTLSHHSKAGGSPYPDEQCPIQAALNYPTSGHSSGETFWRSDQSGFPVEYAWMPVAESGGGDIRLVVTFRDITARKETEEALLRSEARFHTIFDSVDEAIFVHNLENATIVDVNRRACEMYGHSREDMLKADAEELSSGIPPYTRANALERFALAAAGTPQNFEWQARTRLGRLFWVEIHMRRTDIAGKEKLLVTVRDVTDRKETADLISDLYNKSPNGYHSLDAAGTIVHINDTELAWLGYRREEVVGKMAIGDILTEASMQSFRENYLRFRETGHVANLDFEMLRRDGSTLPVLVTATEVRDENGRYQMIRSVAVDMSERRRAGKMLRESEERFRTLFGSIQDGIFVVPIGADGAPQKFIEVNEVACRMLGYTREELLGMSIADVDAADSGVDVAPFVKRLMAGESVVFEQVHVTKDGQRISVEVNANPFELAGQPVVMSLVRDVTERKRMARDASEAHQRLRQLSAHLQTVREEEKASIAREIHDDLGGTLTALKMDAYWLARKLPTVDDAVPLQARLTAMLELLDNAVGVTRRIITELRPSILDDLGLLAALEWQAAQFEQRTGIAAQVECVEDRGGLDNRHAIALFRIFQEALTNVARHAAATRVDVQFHHGDKAVSLLVHDNGRGLGENVDTANRYGIRGMFERASALGGYARIESPPGGGVTVNVIFPLQQPTIEETP